VLALILVAGRAGAELAEFRLSGRVENVSANGDPAVLDALADLGAKAGGPFEALLVYDTDTPASGGDPVGASYDCAVRFFRIRMDGYEMRGPKVLDARCPQGSFGNATVRVDTESRFGSLIFSVSGAAAEDAPDVLFEDMTFEFFISGEPFFESVELSGDLPDPADGQHTASGRIFGGDPVAGRFTIQFDLDSIQRVSAEGPPMSGGEPLLGLNLRRRAVEFTVVSTGCTRKRDFVVDSAGGDVLRLRLRRLAPDPCDAAPAPWRLFFHHRELGIEPGDRFQVVNPAAIVEVR